MSDPSIQPAAPRRVVSLDVLRGVAILLMIFSGMLPKTLPNWVDHGYQPHFRPDAAGVWRSTLVDGSPPFDARWKAFTWVDLVFPMFLFAMGAAIPLAMSRRLERGESSGRAVLTVVGRAVTLALFAVGVSQMTAGQLRWPGTSPDTARGRVMLGFVGTFLFFVRWPRDATRLTVIAARTIGAFIVVGLIVAGVRRGAPFNWGESDTIILVLAHCYLIAAGLWIVTRGWGGWRLVAVAPLLFIAHYRQFRDDQWHDWWWLGDFPLLLTDAATKPSEWLNINGWLPADAWSNQIRAILDFSPLWNVTWYKFLWCVVPGTIVGDALGRWSPRAGDALPRRTILGLAIAISVATFVGLRHYGFATLGLAGAMRTPWLAPALALPLTLAMAIVVFARSTDATHRWLMRVGAASLYVGLALACLPSATAREGFFEGGISKGSPATLSYFATSVGLCTLLLLGLLVTLDDRDRPPSIAPGVLEANGQNPMLAYFLAHSTIDALLTFSIFASMHRVLTSNVWVETAYGVAKTAMIAAIVWLLTRVRVFWRA